MTKDGLVPVSVFVMTYNAEVEIEACLESVTDWAEAIFIVDSHSTDKTLDIARKYTDRIFTHTFEGFANQRNWVLDNLPWPHEWVLQLDQDERLTPELREEVARILLDNTRGLDGFYIKRRFIFMGRWLRHGGYYPNAEIRLFRHRQARVVDAGLREPLLVRGPVGTLQHDMLHDSAKGLGWWISKHNMYADAEAEEVLTGAGAARLAAVDPAYHLEGPRQRSLRQRGFDHLPLFVRPFLLFGYRYILRLGFLDGVEGLIYCFLHDLWYPFLVDAKVREHRLKSGRRGVGAE